MRGNDKFLQESFVDFKKNLAKPREKRHGGGRFDNFRTRPKKFGKKDSGTDHLACTAVVYSKILPRDKKIREKV